MCISLAIKDYVEQNILPLYQNFDKGHQIAHAQKVIADSLMLAEKLDVNPNMVYVIAAYHDIGLSKGREKHHQFSGEMLLSDQALHQWFSQEQIQIMKQAVEDHRASNDYEPRSIYGKIVAEADRDIVPKTIIRRTIQYGLKKHPTCNKEEHFIRTRNHIQEKYGRNGYLKLWLESEKNLQGLEEIRTLLEEENAFIKVFSELFQQEIS